MSYSDERFRPVERLLERAQFKQTSRDGVKRSGPHLIVYARANALDWSRVGLTVTRKVGHAPQRNRWKRRLREIFRRNKPQLPAGFDIVVIVKQSAPHEPPFEVLRDELLTLINEACAS